MKTRFVVPVLLVVGLSWLVAAMVAAQGPESGVREQQMAASTRWVAVSEPGLGNPNAFVIQSLVPMGDYLYAGVEDHEDGADVYRSGDGETWEPVTQNGFGDPNNLAVEHLAAFEGYLYAGTVYSDTFVANSAQIWRSPTGENWTQVTPPGLDPTNKEIGRFVVYGEWLYATTWSYTDTHGSEIWRTDSGESNDWTRVVENGFGDANNVAISTQVFGGHLYVGTWNGTVGGQVWRSDSGDAGDWERVNADGFGAADNVGVSALADFKGYLYASTRTRRPGSTKGVEVWRCQTCDGSDWAQVADNGFGDPDTNWTNGLEVFNNRLYLLVGNGQSGLQAWRTPDGMVWENVGRNGLTTATNLTTYWDNALAVFEDGLYVGTIGDLGGFTRPAEVLRYVPGAAFLPVVQR